MGRTQSLNAFCRMNWKEGNAGKGQVGAYRKVHRIGARSCPTFSTTACQKPQEVVVEWGPRFREPRRQHYIVPYYKVIGPVSLIDFHCLRLQLVLKICGSVQSVDEGIVEVLERESALVMTLEGLPGQKPRRRPA